MFYCVIAFFLGASFGGLVLAFFIGAHSDDALEFPDESEDVLMENKAAIDKFMGGN